VEKAQIPEAKHQRKSKIQISKKFEDRYFKYLPKREKFWITKRVMDVIHKIKVLLAGVVLSLPIAVCAQDSIEPSGVITVSAATVDLSGGTLTLAALPLPVGGTGVFAQSVGGGGGDSGATLLRLGSTLLSPGISPIHFDSSGSIFLAPLGSTSVDTSAVNRYAFEGGTLTLGPGSTGATANQLHQHASGGGTLPNSTGSSGLVSKSPIIMPIGPLTLMPGPGSGGTFSADVSTVPEPGVTALLILGGLGLVAGRRRRGSSGL
jgi:hypothetical protein